MTDLTRALQPKDLASYIDHTLLKPEATKQHIRKLCEEALENHFFAVCVNSSMISTCSEILKNTKVRIASVVGFPLGASESSVKTFEASRAFNLGAHEVDMVINIGALKAKDYLIVEKEISDIVRVAAGNIVKVILETSLLTDEEKIKACEISVQAGAHFVKTSTGFGGGGATVSDIALMKKTVGTKSLVKASGGIKNFADAAALIAAGANRLGTSSGVLLVTGQSVKSGY
ncbi:MAG: deoxyribose-phosphate aldolase [Bdellovibrionales bacterium RIFCSPHIGHO2_01_FULL_40_29]|nr:MAG: deoxyribose-phosphate aldolase [Bdellovibrionales bacterium RIFCSPHIGHO2_01_FULL_40_29]OFZ34725.1 MAG: deoxyribose-phosphate aldolase [Bdellovibrionales bacterium RIFCSPHIGHO2_02_FULL_40_15]